MEKYLKALDAENHVKHLMHYSSLMETKSEEETLAKLKAAVLNLGFSKMKFALIQGPSRLYKNIYLYSNYSKNWLDRYEAQEYWKIDPVLEHALHHKSPLIWNASTFNTPQQRAFYEEANQYGIYAGITLPLGALGSNGLLTCVSDMAADQGMQDECFSNLPQLTLLRDIAFDSLSRFILPGTSSDAPQLTRREKECLQWHALGKTSWETGSILNISEACVNYHFNNIRSKFKVSQRQQAVIKAIMWGLISID